MKLSYFASVILFATVASCADKPAPQKVIPRPAEATTPSAQGENPAELDSNGDVVTEPPAVRVDPAPVVPAPVVPGPTTPAVPGSTIPEPRSEPVVPAPGAPAPVPATNVGTRDWFMNLCTSNETASAVRLTIAKMLTAVNAGSDCAQGAALLEQATHLDLSRASLVSLEPLAIAKNLVHLDVWQNRITDLAPLASIGTLVSLNLKENQIQDLAPLSALSNLKFLSVEANRLSSDSVKAIAELSNLEQLFLSKNTIDSLNDLKNLTQLKVLKAENNRLTDLAFVGTLQALEKLSLSENRIQNMNEVASLTQLIEADLSFNQIEAVADLSNLDTLETLILDGNKITNVDGLVTYGDDGEDDKIPLMNLQTLSLANNLITSVTWPTAVSIYQELPESSPYMQLIEAPILFNISSLNLFGNPLNEEKCPLDRNILLFEKESSQVVDQRPLPSTSCQLEENF